MKTWQWFLQLLFGAPKMPLNEKLRLVIQKDREE